MDPQWSRRRFAGKLFSIGSVLLFLGVLAGGLLGPGCRDNLATPVDRNRPPVTVLTGVPGDSTTNFYRLHLYWNGYDPDGEVVGYEWAVTDSLPPLTDVEYLFTTRTDSIFRFNVEEVREVLGHRFYLRAVDNEGKRDPVPKWTFFTVRNNCVPTSRFLLAEASGRTADDRDTVFTVTSTDPFAPTDTIPAGWGLRFSWVGSDCDRAISPDGQIEIVGRVVGYDHKLVPLEMTWVRGTVTQTSAVYAAADLRSDTYEMRVRSVDDGGLAGSDPELRSFVWNKDPVTSFERGLVPGRSDSVQVFRASITGGTDVVDYQPYTDGDTLPLVNSGVTIRAVVRAFDPDMPHRIVAAQARLVRDVDFWTDLAESGSRYEFDDRNRPNFSGNYRLMARSLDGLGRWDGTPAEIRFSINKKARFLDTWTVDSGPINQRPVEGGRYPASRRDTMMVRFAAYDPDYSSAVNSAGLEFTFRWESYPLPSGGQGSEIFFPSSWRPSLGVLGADGAFRLHDDMSAFGLPDPAPSDPQSVFIPGEYILVVRAREAFERPSDRDRYGYRTADREIHFRLE
jgi:hypothetical protein